ncbi:PPK2 family polyphosphate kinase [Demequina mangrovi]|uniref:Polyphosphate:nucleotide phosphotransferase, PPK2 family n=1 Tax=Demequina mangrovi TaxID=1043493 RepID=A0A1H6U7S4_9MICO|nr:PPK2 family polyphosphate kinase [Demequina mangrovi]SEI88371.1 polyphosphate:nucleotide phosphotransferase, PPK2 family [Demequina mangrovi]
MSGWLARPSGVLRVGEDFDLGALDARSTPGFGGDRAAGEAAMATLGARLAVLQEMLFAEARSGSDRALVLVLQGMDTSGKGGISRHVLGMVDPQGVQVRSFGPPTAEERRHHYLWRVRRSLPRPGHIGVFDRSHYEDVLVARVEGLVDGAPWTRRYAEINRFERQTKESGITVVKCALMISPDEQLARLANRLRRPDRFWKYDPSDLDARAKWDDYMDAYQDVFDHTSTPSIPWHVVPADRKWYARLAVTQLLVDTLEDMNLGWPPATFDVAAERARLGALLPAQQGDDAPPETRGKSAKTSKKAKAKKKR